jgi:prefoldin alpha subunit
MAEKKKGKKELKPEEEKLEMRKNLQEKYVEMQLIDQQMKQAEQQIMQLDKQVVDLATVQEALDDLKKTKKGTELFIPITNGIFAKAKLEDNENLLVNVGSMTAVPKTTKDVKDMLSKQEKEIRDVQKKLKQQIEKFAEKAVTVEQELNKFLKEAS